MLSPPRTSEGTLPTDYTFTGQRVDASAGLLYYGARYYDWVIGRFTQPDTIIPDQYNPQSLNRYSYVLNNPLKYIDPTGHGAEDYYVFVQGCIDFGNRPCGGDINEVAPNDWKDYLNMLRDYLGMSQDDFSSWASTHVKYVRAFSADPSGVANAVNSIDPGNGSIFLIGHSAGGAAILNYLKELKEHPGGSIPRIGGAAAISSPIGDISDPTSLAAGLYSGFERYSFTASENVGSCQHPACGFYVRDNMSGLGAWAKVQGIAVLTVSYGGDWVNPGHQTADIPFKLFSDDPGASGDRWDVGRRHGYFFQNPTGLSNLWQYLVGQRYVR